MSDVKCGNCKFYKINPQDLKQGFCKINPPSIMTIPMPKGISVQGVFPPTVEGDWCGKHEMKEIVQS